MPSSRNAAALGALAIGLAVSARTVNARAQKTAPGFAVERLYTSAPGAGWFVMDSLDMRGGLGGVMALTSGYARKPLNLPSVPEALPVVSDQAFVDFAFAATYDRFRLYLNLDAPIAMSGQSGTVATTKFSAPDVNLSETPDSLTDARLGFDARVYGEPTGPLRLGLGGQLFLPTGRQVEYDSDGTYRAMLRVLVAGDIGKLAYAAHLGVHVRPLDESATPGSPLGSELLFGFAAGARLPAFRRTNTVIIVGPEFYGDSALRSLFDARATGFEGLLTGRIEGMGDDGPQIRVKLGAGAGIDQHFGAPEWRLIGGVELFDRASDRDRDGVTDLKDACPDTAGVSTDDPKTRGCPVTPDADGRAEAEDVCPFSGPGPAPGAETRTDDSCLSSPAANSTPKAADTQ